MSATIASNSDRPTYAKIWNTHVNEYETQTYSYDASGYLTQISSELTDTSKNYVIGLGWNSLGQLSTMTNTNPATTMPNDPTALHGAGSATYYYDAFGARIKKVTKDASGQLLMSTGFMYSDVDPYKILSEYTLNYDAMRTPAGYGNMSSKEYIYLPMPEDQNTWVPVALMRQTTYTGFDVHYLHVDQLGTVQSIVQAKAAASPSVAGANVMMTSYPGVLGDNRLYVKEDFIQNGPFNLRAPGQYFDPETGLLYNNARYFNPRIGAFVSGDPIGRDGGTNVYAYGVGSLVNDVDESGLDVWLEGPVEGESGWGFHQSLSIGDPKGYHFSISFAVGEDDYGKFRWGVVYKDLNLGGKILRYKKTTYNQDHDLIEKLSKELNNSNSYYLIETCRSWSQDQFEKAPGVEMKPPLVYAIPILLSPGTPQNKNILLLPFSSSSSSFGSSTFR